MSNFPEFPGWRHGPNGEARIFQSEADVPKGWRNEPFKDFPKAMAPRDAFHPLDHDGKAGKGGSITAPGDLKALRAKYTAKTGKRAFNGWDEGTLLEKIGE